MTLSSWVIIALAIFVALWTGMRIYAGLPPRQPPAVMHCICPEPQ